MALDLKKAFEEAGIALSKTKLWSEPEMVVEDLPSSEFKLFVSEKFDLPSAYIRIEIEGRSRLIGFGPGEVEDLIEDWDYDSETGEVLEHDLTINLGIVTALRDDKDLKGVRDLENYTVPVTEGVQTVKAYVS